MAQKKHEKHFNLLEKIASAIDPVGRARLAAILVHKNEIIAVGYNKYKSHPFQRKFASNAESIFLHAETDAINNARKNYSDEVIAKSTMYVLRVKRPESNNNTFVRGMAKPCCGCQRALATFDIKNVYYTNDDGGFDFL